MDTHPGLEMPQAQRARRLTSTGRPDALCGRPAVAALAYYRQWTCRLDPFPGHVMHSFVNLSEEVYQVMQGPEWNVTGNRPSA